MKKKPLKCLSLARNCVLVTEKGVPVRDDYVLQPGDSFLVCVKPKTKNPKKLAQMGWLSVP